MSFHTTYHLLTKREPAALAQARDSQLPWEQDKAVSNLFLNLFSFIDSPPPGTYNLTSDFDIGNPKTGTSVSKSHLYSFGGPHSIYKKVYNPECPSSIDTEHHPGPGAYNDKYRTIGTEGRNIKFQGRSLNLAGKYCIINISIFCFQIPLIFQSRRIHLLQDLMEEELK